MNKQGYRDYVLNKLGHPSVAVELTTEHIDTAIEDALDQYNQYQCKAEPRVEKNRAGAVMIPPQPGDRGVIECKMLFPDDVTSYAQMDIFQIMYRMVFPRMPLGDWYSLKVYYKQYQQIRGTDADFKVDASTGVLFVDCHSGPYDIFYVVARDLRLEDFDTISSAYSRDFKKLVLAEAKLTLAKIRGKFGGSIPVPGGSMVTDAAELKSEGEATKTEIVTRLEQIARFSISPVMWG
jgi:hypothetical protein